MRPAGRNRTPHAAAVLCLLLTASAFMGGCRGKQAGTAVSAPAAGGFPVTMTDAEGVSVRVERKPGRVVSLAPAVTEILFAIGAGDRVVAAADPADYPPEARQLRDVGKWFTPSAEKTLAADPDLVIASRGNPTEFVATLRKSGCVVYTVDPVSLDSIFTTIENIGAITGAGAAATEVINGMKKRMAAVAARIGEVPESKRPTAFMVLSTNPVWTAGTQTFQDDAIRAAGARNIASRLKGFKAFSTESLLAADPQFMLLSTMEGDSDRMRREVLADPALRLLSAVRAKRLIVLDANLIMRPGPRIVDAIETMARAFYPDRFPSGVKSGARKPRS